MKKINVQYNVEKRFAVFILISNVVHRSPSWLPNIINTPLLNCFFNILKVFFFSFKQEEKKS